jgi:hypothetical protein
MSQPHGDTGKPHGENPLVAMMVSMSGAAAPEHENAPPGVEAVSVKAGHEPDAFNVKGILYVPALVAATLVLTYVVVQVIFGLIRNPAAPAGTNPQVAAQNDIPFNDRAGRISSTEPTPVLDRPGTAVPQPRLEYIREQAGDDPIYYRSKRPMQERNSPEIRPEDLRPENYVDPATGQKTLADYGFIDKDKKVIRVPIDEAIHMVEHGQFKLPVRKDPVKLAATSEAGAKLSNGGVSPPAGGGNAVDVAPHNEPGKKHDH